jgi:hypothetical protein
MTLVHAQPFDSDKRNFDSRTKLVEEDGFDY